MKHLKLIFLLSIIHTFSLLNAQSIVSTAGNFGANSNVNISWTIGEISTETFSNTSNTLTQGEQQANIILTLIEYKPNILFRIDAFPNPILNSLNLIIEKEDLFGMNYILTDISGKVIEQNKIKNYKTELSFSNLKASTYFLVVCENNNQLKTFKLIKK
jgi:hypothetical protein